MFTLDTRRPAPPTIGLADALARAARDADAVPGAYARAPWRFHPAPESVSAVLEPTVEHDHRWVVVICRRNDAEGHVRERAFTAVQRYLLSLAAEGVDATWIGTGVPSSLGAMVGIQADEEVIGVIRLG